MLIRNFAPVRAAFAVGAGLELRAVARALLIVGLLAATHPASGASGCPDPAEAHHHSDDATAAPAGLRVYVDPETGELLAGPPVGETAAAVPETAAAVEDVPVEIRPDGTVVADIGDRYRVSLHAQIVDGKLVTCHRPVADDGAAEAPAEDTNGD